ncbi:hypothetical protein MFLAVUS_001035 [Mucor flavus]|uniref:Cytochrome b561 domain-containing protein n=1 Tax=Mucor flavus TaxID=439312 RepID=A0ABP9YLF5_9FUNG
MDRSLKNQLTLVHGGLMAFVWLVAVPFAVGANIYARKKNKTWGTKVHMTVMATAAFLPFTISGLIGFICAGTIRLKPHSTIGTILTIGAWIQVIMGVTNHYVFRYRLKNNCLPASRPWNNHAHIWLGRILMVLALVNIPLGMKMKRFGYISFGLYAAWVTLLAIVFTGLIWMKQDGIQIVDINDDEKKS